MTDRETISNVDAVCREVGEARNKTILDVGCGTGALCRALASEGADVLGIDPGENSINQAKELGGDAKYQVATLDDIERNSNSFDVVIFCTSLHHIPDMPEALQAGLNLVKNTGKMIVVEPQPDDPLYPVNKWLDDEKEVQIRAQNAVDEIVKNENLARSPTRFLNHKYRYENLDALIDDMMEVDETRTLSVEARHAMVKAYDKAVRQDDEGNYIDHWYRLDVLSPAS